MSSLPALFQMFTEPYEAYMHGSAPRLVKGHDYAIVEQVGVGVGVCVCVCECVFLRGVVLGVGSTLIA